ncbi:MAG: hypothetical protein PHY43_13360 [Verrucomicrobiales bacterium]|nr:hypothetical protein [Verrucomicrobiales bacterium]
MKKAFLSGGFGLLTGLFLSLTPRAQADANIYWDFDNGFYPSTVQISPGETVTWWNVDPYGFDVQITFDNSFSFSLPNLTGQGVTFPDAGTYGFHSDFGDNGSVTVSIPPITLGSPRNESGQFLFDATGLTVGKTNLLQASTNLTSWVAIKTNVADSASMTFTNATALSRRFFRLVELP